MLNKELYLVFLPAVSWFLFAFGGTTISDTIQGQKWLRRFILPAIYGLCLFLAHFALWQACGVAILACFMLHLGYGSHTSWLKRLLIFLSYGIISLPIGFSVWNIITPVMCVIIYIFSNIKLPGKPIVWKIWEGMSGALLGIQISYLMAGYGFVWIK